jgi:hypothetical protein
MGVSVILMLAALAVQRRTEHNLALIRLQMYTSA